MKKNNFNENGIFYNEKRVLFNFPPLKMGFYCYELKTENGKRRVTDRPKYRGLVGRSPLSTHLRTGSRRHRRARCNGVTSVTGWGGVTLVTAVHTPVTALHCYTQFSVLCSLFSVICTLFRSGWSIFSRLCSASGSQCGCLLLQGCRYSG